MYTFDETLHMSLTIDAKEALESGFSIEAIVQIERFKALIGKVGPIQKVVVAHLDLDPDGREVVVNLALDVTMDGQEYFVHVNTLGQHFLNHCLAWERKPESAQIVNDYLTHTR